MCVCIFIISSYRFVVFSLELPLPPLKISLPVAPGPGLFTGAFTGNLPVARVWRQFHPLGFLADPWGRRGGFR